MVGDPCYAPQTAMMVSDALRPTELEGALACSIGGRRPRRGGAGRRLDWWAAPSTWRSWKAPRPAGMVGGALNVAPLPARVVVTPLAVAPWAARVVGGPLACGAAPWAARVVD
jgi:hypothetical protein